MTIDRATCIEHSGGKKYAATRFKGIPTYKHRVALINKHGLTLEDIEGLVVRHTCDNCRCVNPDHLELGTQQDNIDDMWRRTRSATLKRHYDKVRQEYVRGSSEYGQAALAVKYNMSQSHVARIVNNQLKETKWQSTSKH